MMTELAFLQNHIVKFVFDKGLAAIFAAACPTRPLQRNAG